jgi:TnpA family transposase
MKDPYNKAELISFHGVSKGINIPTNYIIEMTKEKCKKMDIYLMFSGYYAESGLRGGFFHMVNIDHRLRDVITKFLSIKACPNLIGQVYIFGIRVHIKI